MFATPQMFLVTIDKDYIIGVTNLHTYRTEWGKTSVSDPGGIFGRFHISDVSEQLSKQFWLQMPETDDVTQ